MLDDLSVTGGLLREVPPPDDRGALRFRRVRDVGGVVNVTFRFLRDNRRELARSLGVIVGPALVAGALLLVLLAEPFLRLLDQPDAMSNADTVAADTVAADTVAGMVAGYFGFVLLVGLVQVLMAGVLYGYVALYRAGHAGTITPSDVWAEALPRLLPMLAVLGLTVAFYAAAASVSVVPVLGLLVYFAALLYAAPIAPMVYAARALDVKRLDEAIRRAVTFTRGQWLPSFGILLVTSIVAYALALAAAVPASILVFGVGMSSLDPNTPGLAFRLLLAVGSLVGMTAFFALVIPQTAAAFQYFNLAERVEGTALNAALDALGTAVPPVEPPPVSEKEARATSDTVRHEAEPPHAPSFRGGGFDEPAEGRGRTG